MCNYVCMQRFATSLSKIDVCLITNDLRNLGLSTPLKTIMVVSKRFKVVIHWLFEDTGLLCSHNKRWAQTS